MQSKFILMGFAGTGKTVTFNKCLDLLQSRGVNCQIYSTPDSTEKIIQERMVPNDKVILSFEARYNKKIPAEVFTATNKSAAFMEKFNEEPAYRDLEEMFIIDILSTNKNAWFDLGGKASLRADTISQASKIIPIYLYAEHDTIIRRLGINDNWKKRSNYYAAGEAGWKSLAGEHRKNRLSKYINNSSIIIGVEKNNSLDTNEDTEKRFKTTEELATEIFYRIQELQLSCNSRKNVFTRCIGTLFNLSGEERTTTLSPSATPSDLSACLIKRKLLAAIRSKPSY